MLSDSSSHTFWMVPSVWLWSCPRLFSKGSSRQSSFSRYFGAALRINKARYCPRQVMQSLHRTEPIYVTARVTERLQDCLCCYLCCLMPECDCKCHASSLFCNMLDMNQSQIWLSALCIKCCIVVCFKTFYQVFLKEIVISKCISSSCTFLIA